MYDMVSFKMYKMVSFKMLKLVSFDMCKMVSFVAGSSRGDGRSTGQWTNHRSRLQHH